MCDVITEGSSGALHRQGFTRVKARPYVPAQPMPRTEIMLVKEQISPLRFKYQMTHYVNKKSYRLNQNVESFLTEEFDIKKPNLDKKKITSIVTRSNTSAMVMY